MTKRRPRGWWLPGWTCALLLAPLLAAVTFSAVAQVVDVLLVFLAGPLLAAYVAGAVHRSFGATRAASRVVRVVAFATGSAAVLSALSGVH